MNQTVGIIFGLAYILGLLCSAVAWGKSGVLILALLLAIATLVGEFLYRKVLSSQPPLPWNSPKDAKPSNKNPAVDPAITPVDASVSSNPSRRTSSLQFPFIPETVWLMAGLLAVVASFYVQVRTPQPTENDISQLILSNEAAPTLITVRGEVTSSPRVTRSGRVQFWLRTTQVNEIMGNDKPIEVSQDVTGKLYVTVPLLQATGVYPGEAIAVTGILYLPQPPSNPGAFNFQAYLKEQGGFAGFKGRYLTPIQPIPTHAWGWWAIRQRILRTQVRGLGVPQGTLMSAMVLGRRAVDLPYNIRDQFVQVGLAHVLAASGFHVSLLLGVVLTLSRRLSPRQRFTLGVITLLGYVGLTGGSPSVLRAALMGSAALIAFVTRRQVRPLSLLVFVAVLLLIWNPRWIWDLGFQFSFLATLGLLVSAPAIMKRLTWMPPVIASLIAVPLAASIWTLPLQLYLFNIVSPYSIIVNIITTPFVAVITLGGVVSAIAAIVWPTAGSAIAWLFDYPTLGLLAIVEFFNQQPGNSIAVGSLSQIQLIALYSLNCLIWAVGSWRETIRQSRRRRENRKGWSIGKLFHPLSVGLIVALAIVIVPVWHNTASQFQVTVLATSGEPILVIQDRGRVTLINSGSQETARYTVLPFLQRQGINQLDYSISTHSRLGLSIGWPVILERLPVQVFYDNPSSKQAYYVSSQAIQNAIEARQGFYSPLKVAEPIEVGATQIELIHADPPVMELFLGDLKWLLLSEVNLEGQIQLLQTETLGRTQILWWSGNRLDPKMLRVLQPDIAIASANSIDPDTLEFLREQQTQIFWTGRDGALQWTPANGFETTLNSDETDGAFL